MSARTVGIKLPQAHTPGALEMPEDEDEPGLEPRVAAIGRSITVEGDLTGDEDLHVHGRVDGRVALPKHHLVVGQSGVVLGEVEARQVTVLGRIEGNVSVTERIEVCEGGVVDGDITTPRVSIREGATFNGSMTMVPEPPPPAQLRPSKPRTAPVVEGLETRSPPADEEEREAASMAATPGSAPSRAARKIAQATPIPTSERTKPPPAVRGPEER